MNKLCPAVFLDRDGTILNERGYLGDPRKMKFYKGAPAALRRLSRAGYQLVVITNQSGVARGYFTLGQLARVNQEFSAFLRRRGVRLSAIYFCPHLPKKGCSCRKPRPGLPRKAARRFGLDLRRSFVVGDQPHDMELAHRVGARGVLVLTGAGRSSRPRAAKWEPHVTTNLTTAARWIESQS